MRSDRTKIGVIGVLLFVLLFSLGQKEAASQTVDPAILSAIDASLTEAIHRAELARKCFRLRFGAPFIFGGLDDGSFLALVVTPPLPKECISPTPGRINAIRCSVNDLQCECDTPRECSCMAGRCPLIASIPEGGSAGQCGSVLEQVDVQLQCAETSGPQDLR